MSSTPPLQPGPSTPGDDTLRRLNWVIFCVWTALVLYGTLRPVYEQRPPLFPHLDKVVHFGAWLGIGLWGGLLARRRSDWLGALVLALALGVGTEGAQAYIPGRSCDGLDLLADSLGAILGVLAAYLWRAQGPGADRR